MKRREFMRMVVGGAVAAALSAWRIRSALAQGTTAILSRARPHRPTVSIKRFDEEQNAVAAVQDALESIGGIDKIVRPGDRVIIKPNLVIAPGGRWKGNVTGTNVLEGVVRAVVDCGGDPIVAEGTCERRYGGTEGFAEKLGVVDMCKRYGATLVDLNTDEMIRVKVPSPLLWSELYLARQAVECDRFISVPVMKVHRATGVSLGMKNLVGVLSPKYYSGRKGGISVGRLHNLERKLWAERYGDSTEGESENLRWISLGASIADMSSARPIDLVVVDGTFGRERNAPSGDSIVDIKERSGSYLILAGKNAVAVDSIGAHLMRQTQNRLQQLRFAEAKGLGERRIERIHVVGEQLEDVAVPMLGYIVS